MNDVILVVSLKFSFTIKEYVFLKQQSLEFNYFKYSVYICWFGKIGF